MDTVEKELEVIIESKKSKIKMEETGSCHLGVRLEKWKKDPGKKMRKDDEQKEGGKKMVKWMENRGKVCVEEIQEKGWVNECEKENEEDCTNDELDEKN